MVYGKAARVILIDKDTRPAHNCDITDISEDRLGKGIFQ